MKLKTQERRLFESARDANPWWYKAVQKAGGIMTARRVKWSGAENHPYVNFIRLARSKGVHVREVFADLLYLKLSRDTDSGNFPDESVLDNNHDLVNYSALKSGWDLLPHKERLAAMLSVGQWVDVETLKGLGFNVRKLLE